MRISKRNDLVEQFKKTHHENNIPKYIYDKFVYIGAHVKSVITCPSHGDFLQTPDSHRSGSGCKLCYKDKFSQESILNFFQQKFVNSDGTQMYNYDKFIYYGSGIRSIITCPIHGDFEVIPQELKRKTRTNACAKCSKENKVYSQDRVIEDFQEVHKNKYRYDKVVYKEMNKKVIITCPIHGDFLQTPANHKFGSGCMKCKNENLKEPKYSTKEFINILKDIHRTSDSEPKYNYHKYIYNGYYNKSIITCPVHGDFLQTPLNSKVSGCPQCKSNKKEEFLVNLFKEYNINYIYNNRTIIKPLEIDILISDFNFGIEHNGIFWHSFGISNWSALNNYHLLNKNRHLEKTIKMEEQGYQLFHIREDHLLCQKKKDIWKSVLLNKCGFSNKIHARKLQVINLNDYKDFVTTFLEENHLQGSCPASIKLGLQDPKTGNVYSIMTFGKSRYNKNIEYELLRFCNAKFFNVRGAASKLLKYFERTYKPKSIISYANRDWSQGNLYKAIGFKYNHTSEPNYMYIHINRNEIISRQQAQKHKLKAFLEARNLVFIENLSERDNMINNGYRIYYDTGNLVYHKIY